MPKFLIIAAMAAVALGGAAACANKPAPATSQSAAADETKSVCADATAASTAAIATLKAKLTEGMQAFLAGDQAKVLAAQTAAKTTATEWTTKLSELSKKSIKPQVKTALTDGVTTINNLMASFATTTPTDAEAKLNDFTSKLAAACA